MALEKESNWCGNILFKACFCYFHFSSLSVGILQDDYFVDFCAVGTFPTFDKKCWRISVTLNLSVHFQRIFWGVLGGFPTSNFGSCPLHRISVIFSRELGVVQMHLGGVV